jgi:hypothetical protein
MDVINQHFRGFGAAEGFGSHRYAYDIETLSYALHQAGFVRLTPRSYDPALDSELRKLGTLYVDAYKPSAARIAPSEIDTSLTARAFNEVQDAHH